jgi:hypothetical protein
LKSLINLESKQTGSGPVLAEEMAYEAFNLRGTTMKAFALALLAASTVLAGLSAAQAASINGTTIGGATFNRALSGTPPTALSGVGTAVRYQAINVVAANTGNYAFLVTGLNPMMWDTYLHLYDVSFNPLAPLSSLIHGNDDFPMIGVSGILSQNLIGGRNYVAVISGFGNGDAGSYRLDVNRIGFGPNQVNLSVAQVSEPGTAALLGVSLLGLAALRRKRRIA